MIPSLRPLYRGLALLFLASPLLAAEFTVRPFAEAVASVRDAEAIALTLKEAAGWETRNHSAVDRSQLLVWQLPPTTRARQWLLAPPGTRQGALRLVQFDHVEQRRIRPYDQAWDSGGLFDVNVRSADLEDFYRAIDAHQWHAVTEPLHLERFGHTQWLPRGPDGVRLSPIQRGHGVPEGFDELLAPGGPVRLSRAFNATQVVRDFAATRQFYEEVLGFEVVLDSPDTPLGEGPNVFGIPQDQAANVRLDFVVLSPDGGREGTLELIAFQGARGRDHSQHAHPPNLGMLMLRFPVQNIRALERHLEATGADLAGPVANVPMPPYGMVKVLAVKGPEGMWLEFFE